MSVASGSGVRVKGGGLIDGSVKTVCAPSHQLNALAALSRRGRVTRGFGVKRSVHLEKKFECGTSPRSGVASASGVGTGSERLHLWQTDGPGRAPKLRMVVKNALSQVPEKPLGLYDPAFDKDSCGVGFVAELSGESSRKTVPINYHHSFLL